MTVAANVVISTRRIDGTDYANAPSTGDSGDITLSSSLDPKSSTFQGGGTITIGTGAALYAQVEEGSSFSAGDIQITADKTNQTNPVTSLTDEGTRTATVTIDEGAQILGGTIDITSTAGILPATAGMNAAAAGIAKGLFAVLEPVTGLLTLPLAIQISLVDASVEIGKDEGAAVTIQGSGDVTIGATATAVATGNAIYWFNTTFGGAFGLWIAKSQSTITLHDNVTVESTGADVKIAADSTTTAGGAARVSQNLDSQVNIKGATKSPNNPNNIAVAIGVSSTTTNAIVSVDKGGRVISDAGNVAITSDGTENVKVYPETRSYQDGQYGATLALEFATSDIRTLIQGEVQAAGSEVGRAITFDPFTALDTKANTIDVGAGHGYQTGDKVVYSAELGGPIDGLERLADYYVILVEGSSNLIQLAATEQDAYAGIAIDFPDNPTLTGGGRSLPFSQVGDVSHTIDYGFAHGFTQGEPVVYTAAEGKRVGGLVDGQTYYVVLVDGDDTGSLLQLATDPTGTNLVDLDTSPIFTVQSTGRELVVASVEEGPSTITFTEDDGLSAGDAIVFYPALGFQLVDPDTEKRYADGTVFYAIPSPSADDPTQLDPTQIRLALTQADAISSNGYTHAVPLQIDGSLMLGTDHTLSPTVAEGITATATLSASHVLETKARIGGDEMLVKKLSRPEFFGSFLNQYRTKFYDQVNNDQLDDAANNNGPVGQNADTSNKSFEVAASIGYLQVHRTVETVIGSTAVLKSGADINIAATATETGNEIIEAGVSEGKNSEVKVSIGASIAVATYEGIVRAVVNDGAEVDASRDLMVNAQNTRRFPANVESAAGFFESLLTNFESDPATFLGDLNKSFLYPFFTTGWAYTNVAPKSTETALAFTVQVCVDDNTTEAIIAAGADQSGRLVSKRRAIGYGQRRDGNAIGEYGRCVPFRLQCREHFWRHQKPRL